MEGELMVKPKEKMGTKKEAKYGVAIQVYLSRPIYEQLQKLAAAEYTSVSPLIGKWVCEKLNSKP